MNTFEIEISTPDGLSFKGNIQQLSLRSIDGEISILPNHIPYTSIIVEGECRIYENGTIRKGKSGKGVLSVSHNVVKFSTQRFEWI